MWTVEAFAVLTIAMLLGGLVKGVIGMGLPIVSLPIMASVLGLKAAIVLLLVPAMATNLWQALDGGAFWPLTRRLATLLLASLAGVAFGAGILAKSDAVVLTGVLGILLCAYVVFLVTAPRMPEPGALEPILSPLFGATAGLMFGLTGNYVMPGVLYLQSLKLGRDGFVQAMGIAFTVASVGLMTALWVHGQMPADLGLMSAIGLAPVFAGMQLGRHIRGRLDEKLFRQVFCSFLFLLGLLLAGKAFL